MLLYPYTPPSFLFQSAPRSGDRGDIEKNMSTQTEIVFQSAPRSGDRGDAFAERRSPFASVCFNPRPGPETGAIAKVPTGNYKMVVSIRAPVRRPGRY